MRGLAALVFGAVLATIVGCGAREIAVELDFEPDAIAEGARAVEVFVVPSCTGASLDAAPSDPLHHAIVRRTGSMALGGSLPERFGVLALARDTSCGLVAAGCADATRSVDRVRVTLSARSGSTCRACDDGVCGGRLDAGPDDASATDVSVDDALVATPETGCDCVDEDADGSVDEGCAERGAGTVAFQRVLDGPGADALRGAVVGGDGRVWLNGWLGADGFDYGCGVTVGVMGEPQRGPSYLFALDPDDGRCRAMFVRTRDVASSFGMPWPAVGGAWLYTPGGLTRFAMVEGETVAMMPGADFTAGFVAPADDASDLLLLYTARGFAGTAHVGDASVMATNQGLLARVTSTGATWLRAVAPVALAARLSGSAFALVVPNEGASPCGSVVGESRIEIRDAAAPDTCLDVVALAFALAAADEMAATASHGRLWVIARQADDRV
ncbi:MAG: hypothetical protein K1X94_31435, partial [Sandaracinaceae bacterium]|nr:hypothetical protein [Sandaracinaceae bacterium]